ncbi:LysR family transcriptional regulator [Streptacidiphilus pinicola]|uniref:LysR family transcriptional regulator n=1 Tax=Streptacidiphilus pinicola TaxID=2219663 RepID=A0A2X0IZ30_9ACTN|nr:LysR family transcriptional regulator [Streptacidiphilus pinicola]RAG83156.1 LysR family transcriptional regulator [Streptacidiphilus pinicola]
MDLRYLTAFTAVAETGGISAAADRLGYAQSTLSMQVRRLEDELGAQLLRRTSTGAQLTDAGKRLLPYALQATELAERMRHAVRKATPRLRVGALESLADEWLAQVLTAYQNSGCRRELLLTVAPREQLLGDLAADRLDLVFVYDNGTIPDTPYTAVDEEQFVLVAAPEHPLAKIDSPSAADLFAAEFLVVERGCTSELLYRRYGRALTCDTRVGMTTGSLAALRRMVTLGRGIALLPRTAVRAELAAGDLVRIDPGLDPSGRIPVLARWQAGREELVAPLVDVARGRVGGAVGASAGGAAA